MTFEEWLETAPMLALREFCVDYEGDINTMTGKKCRAWILDSAPSREAAEYSYRFYAEHEKRKAAQS
jgi:hypothetical protein